MPNKIIEAMLVSALLLSIVPVYADGPVQDGRPVFTKNEVDYARTHPAYFTINPSSVRVTRLQVTEEKDFSYLGHGKADAGGVLVIIDQIVNIASKIWDIIEQNAPVANIDSRYASAVPQGIASWTQLSEWKKPVSYVYGFYAENFYGVTVIDVQYKVMFTPGGRYQGKGRYLTGVAVVPTLSNIAWGYRFSMKAEVPDSTIANVGTDKYPLASLQLKAAWKISTAIKESDGTSVYYIQGDGCFEEIASPWSVQEKKVGDVKAAAPLVMDAARIF